MCKVSDLKIVDRRIGIHLKNGDIIFSDWYNANGESGTEKTTYRQMLIVNDINEDTVLDWFVDRKRDDGDTIYISDHAMDRLRKRNGWSRKASLRMMQKIYDSGLVPNQVRGRYSAWVRKKEAEKNRNDTLRFYGENLYIFNRNTLVTILPAPRKGSYFNRAYRESIA